MGDGADDAFDMDMGDAGEAALEDCDGSHPMDQKRIDERRGLYERPRGPGPCPKCGSDTVLRNGRKGPFYGCSQYPPCRGSRDYATIAEMLHEDLQAKSPADWDRAVREADVEMLCRLNPDGPVFKGKLYIYDDHSLIAVSRTGAVAEHFNDMDELFEDV